MLTLGISLLILGFALRLFPRWGLFQWGIGARKQMIETYVSTGELDKAATLEHEIIVLQKRVPVYANILIACGIAIIVAAVAFLGRAS